MIVSEKVLEVLENVGWCKYEMNNCNGNRCINGALMRLSGDATPYAVTAFYVAMYAAMDESGVTGLISDFNDRPSTTLEDVRDVLLAAASIEMSND